MVLGLGAAFLNLLAVWLGLWCWRRRAALRASSIAVVTCCGLYVTYCLVQTNRAVARQLVGDVGSVERARLLAEDGSIVLNCASGVLLAVLFGAVVVIFLERDRDAD